MRYGNLDRAGAGKRARVMGLYRSWKCVGGSRCYSHLTAARDLFVQQKETQLAQRDRSRDRKDDPQFTNTGDIGWLSSLNVIGNVTV